MTEWLTSPVLSGITIAVVEIYLLPLLLAWLRSVPDLRLIALINILLGWTVAGWVVAMALALRSAEPPGPATRPGQHPPPSPLPPGAERAGWPAQTGRLPAAAPPLDLPRLPEDPGSPAEGDDQQW
jgi:hypothetical protein